MRPKEFQETETITVDNVEINQSVNIFGCKGTTIIINGKVNAVNLSTLFPFKVSDIDSNY